MRPTFFPRRPALTSGPSRSSAPPQTRLQSRQYGSTTPPPPKPDHVPTSGRELPAQSHLSIPHTPPPVPARTGSRSLRQIIQAGPLGRMGRSYSRFQEKRPYTTQVCSSIVIYLCGDLSAQFFFPPENLPQKAMESGPKGEDNKGVVEEKGGYDPWRTMRHLTVGIGSSIPSYNWFMFLHNSFNFASKPLSILTKVVVQQAVFTPVFNTYFFSVHSLLSGASLEETWGRLKVALPRSIVNSAKFWPMVTAFSFMYVPPQFRNVFSGCIAVGWQTYLSWLNQKAAGEVMTAFTTEPASSGEQVGVAIKA
ncbi:hypothetical protein BDW71DRAFT_184137 [Aspergillus fruticulosus]